MLFSNSERTLRFLLLGKGESSTFNAFTSFATESTAVFFLVGVAAVFLPAASTISSHVSACFFVKSNLLPGPPEPRRPDLVPRRHRLRVEMTPGMVRQRAQWANGRVSLKQNRKAFEQTLRAQLLWLPPQPCRRLLQFPGRPLVHPQLTLSPVSKCFGCLLKGTYLEASSQQH